MSFLVIIDAGSSGSRVQVYSYTTEEDLNHKDDAGKPWELKVEPGLLQLLLANCRSFCICNQCRWNQCLSPEIS